MKYALTIVVTVIMTVGIAGIMGCTSQLKESDINLIYSKCPQLKEYTIEQMKKASTEIANLPSESELLEMIKDYSKLRQACRIATNMLAKQ